jgi:predicted dehydrogenase|eukprot:COSAG01_NODE_15295_length_1353_cov_1.106858_2_plen_59_part_00
MAKPVRFAVVGSNFITDRLLESGRSVPGFVLAAVYSRTAERAAEFGEQIIPPLKCSLI